MRKAFLVLLLLVLTGCAQVEKVDVYEANSSNVEQVNVKEMNDSWEPLDGSPITFNDREVIHLFTKALRKMDRQPGIMEVSAPDYLIELSGEQYFLWIEENGGSIMEPEDTHTLYNLEEASANEIYELLKSEIIPQKNLTNEEVVTSLKKQGLELKEANSNADPIFGMKLNGEQPEVFKLEGQLVYLYNYYSEMERQNGLDEWHEETVMYNLVTYQVFETRNILIFHVYGNEMDADVHAKFLEGLKWIKP